MSTVRESNPWWAMTSAENALGIDSHPFTTASPRAQIVFSVFSLTSPSSRSGAELGAADRAEVAPATNPKVLGLLEVGDGRDVRRPIPEIGLGPSDLSLVRLPRGLSPPLRPPPQPCHASSLSLSRPPAHAPTSGLLFFLMIRRPPRSTPFPSTTLFRSPVPPPFPPRPNRLPRVFSRVPLLPVCRPE